MLLAACEQGDIEQIKNLTSSEPLETRNSQGCTAFAIAAKSGHLESIDILAKAGANINTTNDVIFN